MDAWTLRDEASDAPVIPGAGSYEWRVAEDLWHLSDECRRLLGAAAHEDGPFRHVHAEDRVRVEAHVASLIEAGTDYALTYRILCTDGAVRRLHDRGVITRDAEGRAVAFRGIAVDLTETGPRIEAPAPAEPALSLGALTQLVGRASGLGIYELDLASGAAKWSAELSRIIGRAEEPSAGSMELALRTVHPEDRDRVRGQMQAALSRLGPYELEYRLRITDGTVRWMRDKGEVQADEDGEAGRPARAIGVLIDVTEERTAQNALASSTALLEALFTNAPVGIGAWDTQFRYVRVNRKLAEINGISADEHIGKTPAELLPGIDEIERLYVGWRRILRTHKPWLGVEISGSTPAEPDDPKHWRAHFFPIETHGEVTGIAASVEDVTAQRRAERALRENAVHMRRILDGNIGFVGILEPDGTLVEANATALEAAGIARSDVVGRKFWDAHWWSYDSAVADRLKEAVVLAASGEVVRYDATVMMREGQTITIDFQLSPVRDDAGNIVNLIPSGFDVTERNEALAHARMLMEEINHRSKNMLALVQAIARHTVRASPEDFMSKFSDRIAALARGQDLLVHSNWNRVDLGRLIASQLDYFKDSIGERITLDGPDVAITAEAAQSLAMVLHELATNAGKYGALSGTEGRVSITWQVEEIAGAPALSLTWRETGGPSITEPERQGFGSVLMRTMIDAAFATEPETVYHPEGLEWRLVRGTGGIAEA
ncbi:PAS domain-containing protein [Roseovarius aquimarinus]|uniref:histidine kinase n=1 Tax=Roseovarius aquimarinus TaxID=1229156 RepID=A0ABW7I6A2_9RHOB